MPKSDQKPRTDWDALALEFLNGNGDITDFADKHGMPRGTVSAYAHRHGWKDKRAEVQRKAADAAQAALTESRTALIAKLNEDDRRIARAIQQQIAAHLVNATNSKTALPAATLRTLAATHEVAQRIARTALGASNDTPPPDGDAAAKIRAELADMERATSGNKPVD